MHPCVREPGPCVRVRAVACQLVRRFGPAGADLHIAQQLEERAEREHVPDGTTARCLERLGACLGKLSNARQPWE